MTNRTVTTAAIILSLAAAGAPTATARPVEDPAAPVNQPVAAANGQSSTAVRPNPDEETVTGANANRTSAAVYSRPDKSLIPVSPPSGHSTSTQATAPQAVVRITTPASGFDWGDAGIGAAGGLALAMLGLGGGLVISHHRPRRARRTTALPS